MLVCEGATVGTARTLIVSRIGLLPCSETHVVCCCLLWLQVVMLDLPLCQCSWSLRTYVWGASKGQSFLYCLHFWVLAGLIFGFHATRLCSGGHYAASQARTAAFLAHSPCNVSPCTHAFLASLILQCRSVHPRRTLGFAFDFIFLSFFSRCAAYGDEHDAYKQVAEVVGSSTSDVLVASLGVKTYGDDKENGKVTVSIGPRLH